MLGNLAASQSVNIVLRVLQAIFAVVVLGTDGYGRPFIPHLLQVTYVDTFF
jgi:hypothetical protein